MQATLQKQAKKVIDNLSEDKLKVVIDFMGYLQAKEKIPNALTLATFRKTDKDKRKAERKPDISRSSFSLLWWAMSGSNCRPLPCE